MSVVSGDMKAAVIYQAGGPEVLKIESRPIPKPRTGEVLIRVKAFGLNRSELFTRQGHSPDVKFPRILGIEAAGIIEDAPGGEFPKGATVITAMGGLGREFDGGYAEFTRVPARQVHQLDTDLDWKTLGAIPEMFQTSWGSLFTALRLERGERLLIRGGTTSIGLTAAASRIITESLLAQRVESPIARNSFATTAQTRSSSIVAPSLTTFAKHIPKASIKSSSWLAQPRFLIHSNAPGHRELFA